MRAAAAEGEAPYLHHYHPEAAANATGDGVRDDDLGS